MYKSERGVNLEQGEAITLLPSATIAAATAGTNGTAVAILGEPIGSTILALAIFHQPVRPFQMVGGAVLLAGIAVATLAERRAPAPPARVDSGAAAP